RSGTPPSSGLTGALVASILRIPMPPWPGRSGRESAPKRYRAAVPVLGAPGGSQVAESIMTQSRLSMGLLTLGALALSFNLSAQAQDEGVKQVESLVKRANSAAEALAEAKTQLSKTMDVYNSMFLPDAKDVKGLYKKLQSEMENSEKRRAEVSK